jgi:hypothetical protein
MVSIDGRANQSNYNGSILKRNWKNNETVEFRIVAETEKLPFLLV